MFGVLLGSVLVVLGRMQRMAVRDLGMVRGFFVIAGFVMLGRLAMVLGRVLMMIGGVLVMLVNVVTAHGSLSLASAKSQSIAGFGEPFATFVCQFIGRTKPGREFMNVRGLAAKSAAHPITAEFFAGQRMRQWAMSGSRITEGFCAH
jgi:hypothetical protein